MRADSYLTRCSVNEGLAPIDWLSACRRSRDTSVFYCGVSDVVVYASLIRSNVSRGVLREAESGSSFHGFVTVRSRSVE